MDWPTLMKTGSLQSRKCQGHILFETLGEGPWHARLLPASGGLPAIFDIL